MKKIIAASLVAFAALLLVGCASDESKAGLSISKPAEATQYFDEEVDIYFTDGQSVNCLISKGNGYSASLLCNWRSVEAIGELKVANDSDYDVRYIKYKGETTPCIFGKVDSEKSVSCGFGVNVH